MTNTTPVGTAVPPSMALAWGRAGAGGRGPKRALSIERIVDAGMAVARAEGLAAVSMARVAGEVGVSTMALYRYVDAKDDLLELMVDRALGLPPEARPGETWRDGLRRWAEGCRDAYRANQWTLRVPISAPPLGPNNVRWLENALTALRDLPLTPGQKTSCVVMISGFIRSEELLLADLLASQATGRDPLDYGRALTELIDPAEFPQIEALINSGSVGEDDGIDAEFEFGIERILDGIAALIDRAG